MAEAAGLAQRVYFPGFVDDLEALYQESDVLLMCSQNEAMGRVTAEAFAHRIPVIAYKGGANPELVSHKKEGLLYKDDAELVAAMQQLAKDADLRKQMGEAGHEKALTLFTEERYAEAVEQVYKKVLKHEK
jgi:glycosyltransferase involved in cell wall biosynthesis